MKNFKNFTLMISLLLWGGINAQVEDVEEWNDDAQNVNVQVTEIDTTIQDFGKTIGNLSSTISGIFGGNKKTVVFLFPGVEFGNENLNLLAQHLRKMKEVKKVGKRLDNGLVSLEIKSKTEPTALWVKLPEEVKSHFKVVEASEKGMMLHPKNVTKPKNQAVTRTTIRE